MNFLRRQYPASVRKKNERERPKKIIVMLILDAGDISLANFRRIPSFFNIMTALKLYNVETEKLENSFKFQNNYPTVKIFCGVCLFRTNVLGQYLRSRSILTLFSLIFNSISKRFQN